MKKHPTYDFYLDEDGNIYDKNMNIKTLNKNTRYYRVYKRIGGKFLNLEIHRLMIETFIGQIPKGMQVNHINGDRYDNRLVNLEVVTPLENMQHAHRNGLIKYRGGEDNPQAKLKESEVLYIYEQIKRFKNNKEIADELKLPFRLISLLRNGSRWKKLFDKHFTKPIPSIHLSVPLTTALDIIDDSKNLSLSNVEIGIKYNIDPSNISRLRSGKLWTEVISNYEQIRLIYNKP
jgi:hypothetical protein